MSKMVHCVYIIDNYVALQDTWEEAVDIVYDTQKPRLESEELHHKRKSLIFLLALFCVKCCYVTLKILVRHNNRKPFQQLRGYSYRSCKNGHCQNLHFANIRVIFSVFETIPKFVTVREPQLPHRCRLPTHYEDGMASFELHDSLMLHYHKLFFSMKYTLLFLAFKSF